MTRRQVDAALEYCAAATQGPWIYEWQELFVAGGKGIDIVRSPNKQSGFLRNADGEFCAKAREALPQALLALRDAARVIRLYAHDEPAAHSFGHEWLSNWDASDDTA